MNDGRSRPSPVGAPAGVGTLAGADPRGFHGEPGADRAEHVLWRRRLRHDIRHELGTIIMLASAVVVADDIGDTSRARVEQILGETRWLDHLLRQLDEDGGRDRDDGRPPPGPERIRVDIAARSSPDAPATAHEVCLPAAGIAGPSNAVAHKIRNVIDSACRVAEGA